MTRALTHLRTLLRLPAAGPLPAPARPTRSRAKRTVLAGFVAAAVLHLGLNVALDTAKPEWRDPEYGHRVKELKPLAKAAGHHPVVVALGSSRSQMGLSPTHLGLDGPDAPIVYNLSQAGCGPVHQFLNLHRLLDAGVKPDFLLVEVLPPVLGGHGPADGLLIPARLSLADLRRVEPYCDDFDKVRGKWLMARKSPWYAYRINLLSHWGMGSWYPWQARQDFLWKQMRPRGWMPYFFPQIDPARRAKGTAEAKAQYAAYFADFSLAPLPRRAHRDLLDLCRERGIRVAFYVMPESPTFRSWYPSQARERINGYFAELRREAPVFDASDWLDDEGMYADGHHLMRHGAEAFSGRFGRECVGPWVQGERGPRP
jgi:hypothetical protein